MPPPRITTDLPIPALPGQSPGRGETTAPGGGGDCGGGGGLDPVEADDDPQAEATLLIPNAAIVRNIAVLPAARPTDARNSRRAM